MKSDVTTEIIVKEQNVRVIRVKNVEYISLTDLAKYQNSKDPSFTIKNWLRRTDTINYVGLWEQLSNPDFNLVEFDQIKSEYGVNAFSMSPTQWIKRTNAIGFIAKGGKYSIGTFAHPDIAFEFASWLSPEFKLYLIKEFERLKFDEAYRNKIDWKVKRELAKTNYLVHTGAIKENLIPTLSEKQKNFIYANEADLLNVSLFGMTAKEWQNKNPDKQGNMRDYANILQLIILVNLENVNANMINDGVSKQDRLVKLNEIAKKQMTLFQNNKNITNIEQELFETE